MLPSRFLAGFTHGASTSSRRDTGERPRLPPSVTQDTWCNGSVSTDFCLFFYSILTSLCKWQIYLTVYGEKAGFSHFTTA